MSPRKPPFICLKILSAAAILISTGSSHSNEIPPNQNKSWEKTITIPLKQWEETRKINLKKTEEGPTNKSAKPKPSPKINQPINLTIKFVPTNDENSAKSFVAETLESIRTYTHLTPNQYWIEYNPSNSSPAAALHLIQTKRGLLSLTIQKNSDQSQTEWENQREILKGTVYANTEDILIQGLKLPLPPH